MPSSSADTALRDMLRHIELAEQFTARIYWPAFQTDLRTVYAVTLQPSALSVANRVVLQARGE